LFGSSKNVCEVVLRDRMPVCQAISQTTTALGELLMFTWNTLMQALG
jgi:hypothetical protein